MEFLKGLFAEPLSFEAFQKAVQEKGIKLADLSTGKYADVDKLTKANNDLKTANDTIKKMTDEIDTLKANNASAEEWKSKFEGLQEEINKEKEAAKAKAEDQALTDAIMEVIGNKNFSSEYAKEGVIRDMKTEIAKPENKGKGYDAIFEGVTKGKEGILANPNPPANMTGMGKVSPDDIADDKARAVMGLPPLKQ